MRLDPEADARRLRDGVDLLIVGCGATGLGCAVDAAARGWRVAVIDRGDISCGTSSRSTKLVHGGVRYLEAAVRHADGDQWRLVQEALVERSVLGRLAPHLVRPLELVCPARSVVQAAYVYAGLQAYAACAGHRGMGPTRWWSRQRLASLPELTPQAAGASYRDGQFDDARYAVGLARLARQLGALVVTRTELLDWQTADGHITGARIRQAGTEILVPLHAALNAAGPFADQVRGACGQQQPLLRTSSGIHLVFDRHWWPHDQGLLVPETADGRVAFVLPWHGRVLVGTTDRPAPVDAHPQVEPEAVDGLLSELGRLLRRAPVRADIRAAWCGLRPLVRSDRADTSSTSREHLVHRDPNGLVSIVGGKWTTYRRMAADAVDSVAAGLPTRSAVSTAHLALPGCGPLPAPPSDCPETTWQHLCSRYGSEAGAIWRASDEPSRRPIHRELPDLHCEIDHAVHVEGARSTLDILLRRTRIGLLDEAAAVACAPVINTRLAPLLGWDARHRARDLQVARDRLQSNW